MTSRASARLAWLVAIVVAIVAGTSAPAPWPEGPATLRLARVDGRVVEAPLTLGDATPLDLKVEGLQVALPDGAPLDHPVEVRVSGGDVARVSLGLRDGRDALLPTVERGPDHVLARRRPVGPAAAVLALLGAVVVLWVTEVLPLWVTALLVPVALVATGAGAARPALAPFFHPVIALFFGGFLMAEAMKRARLDHLVAVHVVGRFGTSPATLFAAVLGVSAFLSMWMSNTAAVAVLIPIAMAVTGPLQDRAYRKVLILGLAYAATVGGVGSAVGTPANPIAMDFLGRYAGRLVGFVEWFAFGLPFVLVFLPVMGAYLWWRGGVQVDPARFAEARALARAELEAAPGLDRQQRTVGAVFLVTVGLWLAQSWHGVHPGIVAIGGAAALAALGQVTTDDLGRISWGALLTFGGGLTLGEFVVESGASDWIATRLEAFAGLSPALSVALVGALALGLTTVASNTASAAVLIPLAIPLSAVLGVSPALLVLVVAVASSVDFALVIGTPPTMMAYSTGLFSAGEIFRKGVVLDLLGLLLLVTAVAWFWQAAGLL